mgnify:CR=1 FL=1
MTYYMHNSKQCIVLAIGNANYNGEVRRVQVAGA